MRERTFVVMVCILMLPVSLKADLDVFPICTESNDQLEPDINGEWVVWYDTRNGTLNCDIYGYTLAEPNEVAICTVSGSHQRYAKVSDDTVVWQDERDGQRDIRAFDLVTRMPLDLPNMPLGDNYYQRYPDISDGTIIYQHKPGSYYNLFAYDVAGEASEQISAVSTNQINHAVDGNIVVWTELVGSIDQVFMCDLETADSTVQVSESTYGQWHPAVSGNLIVWAEDKGAATGMDLYGFDISDPNRGTFSVYVGAGEQNCPAISGNLVVWQDKPDEQTDYDIWAVDLTGGGPFPIVTSTINDQNPAISGRTVVWQRKNENWDIVRAVIPASTVISVDMPVANEMFLAGSEVEINWHLVSGTAPDFVDITFSSDNGATWPITVATDVSFADSYLWASPEDANSVQCKICVTAVGNESASGIGDSFTIFQCRANLTADVTGDCFVGFEDFAAMAAQWLTCGNPHNENWCFN